eukprot:scaffold715_cov192-Alexandrium_tamarense.AAC.43
MTAHSPSAACLLYSTIALISSLGVASFQPPLATSNAHLVQRIQPHPVLSRTKLPSLNLSNDDNDDADLAREIEKALNLAKEAVTLSYEDEEAELEAEIDEIASALLSGPPRVRPPTPPKEEPPVSVWDISLDVGEGGAIVGDVGIDGSSISQEIEESKLERETMIKDIESQFAIEKDNLMAQLGTASDELQQIIDQSAQNITRAKTKASQAEKELLSRMDQFTVSIKEVTQEGMTANLEKEQLMNTKQQKIDKAKKEGETELQQYKATVNTEGESVKLFNAKLQRKADEAEKRVRDMYEKAKQIRADRISLQQQIAEVETESLEQITTLERQLKEDDVAHTAHMKEERARIDKLISDAKEKYQRILDKEKAKRESVESEFIAELSQKDKEGRAAISVIESKAKAKLDELEKKLSKERVAIYQEKVEAVGAIRKEMLAELEIENAKLESIHKENQVKLAAIREEIAQVKAMFEQELAERQQAAEEERQDLLRRLEDVRADMIDKINTQQKIMQGEKDAYLEEQNDIIAESEEECRRAWIDLASLKKRLNDAGEEKKDLAGTVAEKSAIIEIYEKDRSSFRKSLRLSFKVAREKIGSGTRRVLRRDPEKTP